MTTRANLINHHQQQVKFFTEDNQPKQAEMHQRMLNWLLANEREEANTRTFLHGVANNIKSFLQTTGDGK